MKLMRIQLIVLMRMQLRGILPQIPLILKVQEVNMEVQEEENVKAIIIIVLAPKKLNIQIQGDQFIYLLQ